MGSVGFEHVSSHLDGLRVFVRTAVADTRGEFSRVFDSEIIRSVGVDSNVRQVNYVSNPRRGTVRGLHYQKAPHEETKTVTCLRGRAFDVAVDIRKDSPTFLQWHAEILDTEETKTIVIPGDLHTATRQWKTTLNSSISAMRLTPRSLMAVSIRLMRRSGFNGRWN